MGWSRTGWEGTGWDKMDCWGGMERDGADGMEYDAMEWDGIGRNVMG